MLIQTCVKAKIGCGEPLYVYFEAPLDFDRPDEEIDYKRFIDAADESDK